jgi:hypothetical protein
LETGDPETGDGKGQRQGDGKGREDGRQETGDGRQEKATAAKREAESLCPVFDPYVSPYLFFFPASRPPASCLRFFVLSPVSLFFLFPFI